GCWGLLDEFHQVNNDVLSVLLSEIQSVLLAVRAGQNMCTLDEGKEISVHQNFSVFLTFCTTRHNYELPPEVHALFRSVSMVMPDVALILRAQCAGQGFKSPRMLADRLKLVTEICSKQL
ncbi:predicted protein, partial [Nematostella vectensis]